MQDEGLCEATDIMNHKYQCNSGCFTKIIQSSLRRWVAQDSKKIGALPGDVVQALQQQF
jgi:hypothetical protein